MQTPPTIRTRFLYRFYLIGYLSVVGVFTSVFHAYPETIHFLSIGFLGGLAAMFGMFASYHNGVYHTLTGRRLWW